MNITLTGIDSRTTHSDVSSLLYPGVELGVLYTANPDGRNRYPTLVQAAELLSWCDAAAVHVCGSEARRQLLAGELGELTSRCQRIQVNGAVSVEVLKALCDKFPKHTILTQHTERNALLASVPYANHALLVDGSGGRGVVPEQWERPLTPKAVGFAGGLTPDNIEAEWTRIEPVFSRSSWLDMETGIRTDDWFDAEKARRVVMGFLEIYNNLY